MLSTHGFALNEVGGNVPVMPGTDPELAIAAISATEAVIQKDGQTFYAPIDQISTDAVEPACNDDGCTLIPDDDNPENDVVLDDYMPEYLTHQEVQDHEN